MAEAFLFQNGSSSKGAIKNNTIIVNYIPANKEHTDICQLSKNGIAYYKINFTNNQAIFTVSAGTWKIAAIDSTGTELCNVSVTIAADNKQHIETVTLSQRLYLMRNGVPLDEWQVYYGGIASYNNVNNIRSTTVSSESTITQYSNYLEIKTPGVNGTSPSSYYAGPTQKVNFTNYNTIMVKVKDIQPYSKITWGITTHPSIIILPLQDTSVDVTTQATISSAETPTTISIPIENLTGEGIFRIYTQALQTQVNGSADAGMEGSYNQAVTPIYQIEEIYFI